MAKRVEHPALAKIEKRSAEEMRSIMLSEGFSSLTLDQKHFISNYCYHRDWKKAQLISTVSSEWLLEQEADPAFMDIVKEVLDQPEAVALAIARDAAPQAMFTMLEMMEQGKNMEVKFKATNRILEMAGVAVQEESRETNFNVSIQMWSKNEPVESRIIDPA